VVLLGAYQALEEQLSASTVTMHIRTELLDVVIVNGRARGIVTRDLVTGHIECHAADVIVLATGGYSNVFYLSTNAKASNCTATWEWKGSGQAPALHKEPLKFEYIPLSQRSYK
jgi:succinate dehydrogenase / fumarate reductase flavoprotein subunit